MLTVEKQAEDLDLVKERLLAVLDLAIEDFDVMRAVEGERLAADILGRADTVERLLGEVEARSPQTVADYRARLEGKMREVLQNTQIDTRVPSMEMRPGSPAPGPGRRSSSPLP